jgi:peptidoglycan/xylan/chitin deacetylase (PgdA/CDA1 family)
MITHIVSLSFDDGILQSSVKTAEIYGKFGLSACINVIATGHLPTFEPPDAYHEGMPKGDFTLWNELQGQGHEIMPHSLKHDNLTAHSVAEAKRSIEHCLEIFSELLVGFDPKEAVFNFPYNASTPALEDWLPTVVKAFRTGGDGINPLPHQGQVRLTCTAFGPGNCEQHLDDEIEKLLARPSGWLIYNTHGLDDEGWGPIRSSYLERLLDRLLRVNSLAILPVGQALALFSLEK